MFLQRAMILSWSFARKWELEILQEMQFKSGLYSEVNHLKRLNHVLTVLLAVVMLALAMVPMLPTAVTLIVMLLCVLGICFLKRGTFYYADANNKIYNKDSANAGKIISNYKKALKAGIPYKKMLTAGAVLIQHGDKKEGREALHDIEKHSGDQSLINQARIQLALSYYMDGELDMALELTDRSRESSYRDKNFYINGCTFYLKAGRISDFHSMVDEFRDNEKWNDSPAIRDLIAVDAMLSGSWKKASEILTGMVRKASYNFADPYMHLSQVKMHFGFWQEAVSTLKLGIEKSMFTPGAVIGREVCERAIAYLENAETRDAFIMGNEKDPLALVNGEMPRLIDSDEKVIEVDPGLEEQIDLALEEKAEDEEIPEGDVDTSLTDDDEVWLRKHGL